MENTRKNCANNPRTIGRDNTRVSRPSMRGYDLCKWETKSKKGQQKNSTLFLPAFIVGVYVRNTKLVLRKTGAVGYIGAEKTVTAFEILAGE